MSDIGINFRGSSGYVTDGANETYALGSDAYPTTRGGFTFGWSNTSDVFGADRNDTNDRRLAGINYTGVSTRAFNIDLPSTGDWTVHLAIGDANGGLNITTVTIKDNTTTLDTVTQASTTSQHFTDAEGTDWLNTTWAANEVGVMHTFSSTACSLNIAGTLQGFAHVRLTRDDDPSVGIERGRLGPHGGVLIRPAAFKPGRAR